MSGRLLLELSASILGATLVALGVILVLTKLRRDRRVRRRGELVDAMRPAVLAALDDPDATIPTSSTAEREALESVLASLLTKTRGADRDALAALLERTGALDRARTNLRSRSAARRQRAADLLGAAGDAACLPALLDRLVDRDAGVRTAAARALGRVGDPRAVGPLLSAAIHHRVPVGTVTMAVLRIGPAARPSLRDALELGIPRERAMAADLLGELGDIDSTPALVSMVRTDDHGRLVAIRALGRIGDPAAAPDLIARLDQELDASPGDADAELMITLARALGGIGDRRAIPVLTRSLGRTRRLSLTAAEALAPMGPRRTIRSMRERAAVGTGPSAERPEPVVAGVGPASGAGGG